MRLRSKSFWPTYRAFRTTATNDHALATWHHGHSCHCCLRFPTVPPRKRGRVNDSVWLSQAEFDAFTKKNDLVPPRNPDLYSVWVRSGSFVVVAVSMKSGDRIAVSKVSML